MAVSCGELPVSVDACRGGMGKDDGVTGDGGTGVDSSKNGRANGDRTDVDKKQEWSSQRRQTGDDRRNNDCATDGRNVDDRNVDGRNVDDRNSDD